MINYDRKKKRNSRLSDGCTVLAITTGKKKDTVVCLAGCGVVLCQFLVMAGNWQFFCCGGEIFIMTGKKDTVVCPAGARSLLRPEKKKIQSSVCWVSGSGDYDRKKKRYSHLFGGLCCCIVSVFGSGGKVAVFLLWREIFITTGKKKDTVIYLASFEH